MSEQQYAVPVNYFVPTASEAAELQQEAGDLRKTVDNLANPWVERTRAEQQLKAVEIRLQAFRREEEKAPAQAQQTEEVTLNQVQNAGAGGRYVLCGKGANQAYLWFKWGDKSVA